MAKSTDAYLKAKPNDKFDPNKKPSYYTLGNGKDLTWFFKQGLIPKVQLAGFYICCIMKYLIRYPHKGQRNSDLDKIVVYAKKLRDLESIKKKGK